MSKLSGLRYLHLCWLAKPVEDRLIYKTIKKQNVKSIVEFGLGDGQRCEKIIQVCQKFSEEQTVSYTGIDLFDSRPDGMAPISLLDMHKRLKKTGAKINLVPGDAESATARVANTLAGTDLILLTCEQELDQLDRFWFFLPRMVHNQSTLLVHKQDKFQVLKEKDWTRWTNQPQKTSRAA